MHKVITAACLLSISAAVAQAGTTVFRLEMMGTEMQRRAVIHIPDDILATKTLSPVIFALHDQGSAPSIMERKSNLLARADSEGFIVVFPAGHSRDGLKGHHWNVAPFEIPEDQIPMESDIAFMDRIADHLEEQQVLDREKIYIAGFGSGGSMAYRLACENPEKFSAIASVGGTMTSEGCLTDAPVSVLHLHGMNDKHIPYLGGAADPKVTPYTAQVDNNFKNTQWPDAMTQLRSWERRLTCNALPEKTSTKDVICSVTQCDSEATVKSCLSLSAGHEWMGSERNQPGIVKRKKSGEAVFSATSHMWDFFREAAGPKSELNDPDAIQVLLEDVGAE